MKITTSVFCLCTFISTYSAIAQVSEPVFSAIIGLGAGTMINGNTTSGK